MKKVLVTGSNGLLGSNLMLELLGLNYKVKGLVRNPSTYLGPNHPNLELVQGSLFDDLTEIMEGCFSVIHVAAETSPNLLNYSDYHKTNVEGTMNLLHAAVEKKLEKFLFVSTANTVGYADDFNSGEEHQPMKAPYDQSYYALSKLEAEERILQYSDRISILITNPTFMLGAYDTKPSSGRIILMGANKKIVFCPPGGKNFVNVRDVAKGLISCLEFGNNGEKYLLSGENMSYREFFIKLNALHNRNPVMVNIPKLILMFLGHAGEILRRLNIKTSLSLVNMKILCVDNYYSNKKSKRELKLRYQPIEQGITEALTYFKEKGKIK
jgi:dihydroflavonol-4-reductase